MGFWTNLVGTTESVFKIGKSKSSIDASGLTALRTITLPDRAGEVVITAVSSSTAAASPLAWNSNSYDAYVLTAQDAALTINADAGSPSNVQKIIFRIKDDGTARALTWTTGSSKSFRVVGVTLPTTTVVGKTTYVGCIYNSAADRWDAVVVAQEI